MVSVVSADPAVAMSAAFGRPSRELQDYIRNNVNSFVARNSGFCPEITNRVMTAYQDFTTGAFARRVNAVRNKIKFHFRDETEIKPLTDIGALQNPPDAMIPYIMSHPRVKEAFSAGEIDGYDGRYVNRDDQAGVEQFEYRDSISTMVLPEPERDTDNGKIHMVSRQYFEPHQSDIKLTTQDRLSIHLTYESIVAYLEEGMLDPTSSANEMIG